MNVNSAVFALRAAPDGTHTEILLDGVTLVASEDLELSSLIPSASRAKLDGFLSQVEAAGAVAGWEIPVCTEQGVRLAIWGGSRVGDRLAVVGHLAPADVYDLYDELSRVNNEQSNALRRALKQVARLEAATRRGADVLLDDMTKLNNELSTLQRDLSKKHAQLSRLDQQKNQLLGMVAHDLRNPLGVVSQFSKMVRRRAADRLEAKEAELLVRIEQTSGFMLSMVEDLLDLSAIESGEITLETSTFSLAELVAEAVGLEELHAADKDVELEFQLSVDTVLGGDQRKLVQVLTNLVSNGVKYGPSGGRVTVETERTDRGVRISVTDQGPGIPPQERKRLFQPFGTTSVKATGGEKSTGLGLLIARKVVEAHGGTIGVQTEVGAGSTFWVELPLG